MSDVEVQAEAWAETETGSSGETVEAVIERMLPDDGQDESALKDADEPPKAKAKGGEELEDLPGDDVDGDEADEDDSKASSADADEDDDEPAPDEEEEDEPEDDSSAALDHAYEVLAGAKAAPFSILKSTPKAALIAWAKQVEEKQLRESASDSPEAKRATGDSTKDSGRPAASKPDASWLEFRTGAAKSLGVDEEALEGLKPLYDRAGKADAISAEIEALRVEIRERDGRETINREMRRLEASYPALKANERKAEKVIDEARTLVAGLKALGKKVNAEQVFTKAAQSVLGAPKRSDLAALRRNGTATLPHGTREGLDTTKSTTEYWDKAVTHAMAGRADLIGRLRPPPTEAKNGRPSR